MLENHVIQTRGFHNTVDEKGNTVGFQFCMRTKYYRVLWLSQFRPGDVVVDGVTYPREEIVWEINGVDYTPDEMLKLGDVAWQVTDAAAVKVKKNRRPFTGISRCKRQMGLGMQLYRA
jgi:hypothetical protein